MIRMPKRRHRPKKCAEWLRRRNDQSAGLSHRSSLSMMMKTQMLTRITEADSGVGPRKIIALGKLVYQLSETARN